MSADRRESMFGTQTQGTSAGGSVASLGPAGGFTLMELLIVIAVLLVLTLIAIPNLSPMRVHTNENAAIAASRLIYQAEMQYQAKYPTVGFACTLGQLGGDRKSATPTPQAAQVLPPDLADGEKAGYQFSITNCVRGNGNTNNSFEIIATPKEVGKTGHRGFCTDAQNTIKFDPLGGTDCTQSTD